jgi:cytidine deaminase
MSEAAGRAPAWADRGSWVTAIASLCAGAAFLGLWFWLLPVWFGFRNDAVVAQPWRWAAAFPSAAGFAVALRCIWDFGWTGRGTPVPIAPPQRLVVVGFYRYVRNPMYVGFFTGWAFLWILFGRANPVAISVALSAVLAIHVFVLFYEEPTLRKRFGADYDNYRGHVRRWVPRMRPWAPLTNLVPTVRGTVWWHPAMSDTKLTRRTLLASMAGWFAAVRLAFAWPKMEERAGMSDPQPSANDALADRLRGFNESSRRRLLEIVGSPDFAGRISASNVEALAKSENKDVAALMLELLPLASSLSRPPISNFKVGAVARGVSGSIYLGANLEFSSEALGFTVHAEQSAISNAYMHREDGIAAIAVTAAPCGHCRQFMNELSPTHDIAIVVKGSSATKLSALLPSSFGPKDLGGSGALPIKPVRLHAMGDAAVAAAVEAASISYAPYSKSPSGVALVTRSGRTFKGAYIENAAFNPSLPPLQSALLALVAAGEDFRNIANVVLAELESPTISQRSVTETTLKAVAPEAKLQVVRVQRA